MKTVKTMAAQGDVLFRRVKSLPKNVKPMKAERGEFVVAHSETGHHHTVAAKGVEWFVNPQDQLTSYLVLKPGTDGVDVVHHRAWDTHETLRLLNNTDGEVVYEIRRQREMTPEGWKRVED